jgi:Domain of unknown function (DUF222)
MDTADLEARLADACGVLNAAHAQLVSLIAEALETGAWDVPGVRCAQHWVAWKTGLSPGRAKQVVQIASRTSELPVTLGMFADGELAIDQVSVVSRFAPEHNDSQAAELAKHATVSQLSRSLASYWKGAKPAAPDVEPDKAEKDPEPEESVYAFFDDDALTRFTPTSPPNAVPSLIKHWKKHATLCFSPVGKTSPGLTLSKRSVSDR